MSSQAHNYSYDILRIIACVMIVADHAPMPGSAENGLFLSSLSYLTAPGVGLFFMISGALLLPVRTDTRTFLRKRFLKIAVPALVWTLLYLLAGIWTSGTPISWQAFLSIPFSAQGNPTFWFIYTLLGLYLLAPVLSRWLAAASHGEMVFYLGLWGISLCYPLLRNVLDINATETGVLYYFSGYSGYFILGFYLRKYPEKIRFAWLLPLLAVSYAAPVVCKLKPIPVDFYDVFWNLSIFVVIQCVFLWKLVVALVPPQGCLSFNPLVARVSSLTFPIYLVHFFVVRDLLWKWPFVCSLHPYALQTLVIILLALAISTVFAFFYEKVRSFCHPLSGTRRRRT